MHRYATAFLLFAMPVQAHEHPREFADNNGKWFDNLERPDNAQHPERFGGNGSHLCCTDKDAVQVQTKWDVPEGAKYPEPVWQVWIRRYSYTTASGFVMRWVIVPKETIIHERPPGIDDDPVQRNRAWAFLGVDGTVIRCFIPPLPEN
jgi:hypothetical protein